MEELYEHVSEFLLRQFEKQAHAVPQWIHELIEKYFRDDFKLKLKRLALSLLLNDVAAAEDVPHAQGRRGRSLGRADARWRPGARAPPRAE